MCYCTVYTVGPFISGSKLRISINLIFALKDGKIIRKFYCLEKFLVNNYF